MSSSGDTIENYRRPLAMVTTLFFMWGFLTSLNDILIPHLKTVFDLNYAKAMLIQFAFFTSYFVFSLPSGKLIDKVGYKKAMVAGLFTMGIGALLFLPAASVPSFPFFLTALIVLAAGMTILQVSANPYVAILGPEKTAASRLNLAQAFNSLGTTIGPKLGGMLILSGAPLAAAAISAMSAPQLQAYRVEQASSVKTPYLIFALALMALGVAIALFKLPAIASVEQRSGAGHDSIWRHTHLILGAIGIFVYVGAEVSIGSFLVNYFSQPDIGNISELAAAGLLSFYWGGAMVGRFIGSALQQKIAANKILGVAAIVAALLVITSMLTFGHVAMWTIIAVGLFNSVMFPTIFTLAIEGLGPLTGDGSGLLVAAIVGGAIIPEIQGIIADRIGIHHAFFLPILCYMYIAYFAFVGSQKKQPVRAAT
ncbi:MAG TPA: sugar MFS transporter [Candidatus Eremiobacteraceae bacterium]|nr:sugar MFS transporter [Candidatus Eremiobacteraceae bacterium]